MAPTLQADPTQAAASAAASKPAATKPAPAAPTPSPSPLPPTPASPAPSSASGAAQPAPAPTLAGSTGSQAPASAQLIQPVQPFSPPSIAAPSAPATTSDPLAFTPSAPTPTPSPVPAAAPSTAPSVNQTGATATDPLVQAATMPASQPTAQAGTQGGAQSGAPGAAPPAPAPSPAIQYNALGEPVAANQDAYIEALLGGQQTLKTGQLDPNAAAGTFNPNADLTGGEFAGIDAKNLSADTLKQLASYGVTAVAPGAWQYTSGFNSHAPQNQPGAAPPPVDPDAHLLDGTAAGAAAYAAAKGQSGAPSYLEGGQTFNDLGDATGAMQQSVAQANAGQSPLLTQQPGGTYTNDVQSYLDQIAATGGNPTTQAGINAGLTPGAVDPANLENYLAQRTGDSTWLGATNPNAGSGSASSAAGTAGGGPGAPAGPSASMNPTSPVGTASSSAATNPLTASGQNGTQPVQSATGGPNAGVGLTAIDPNNPLTSQVIAPNGSVDRTAIASQQLQTLQNELEPQFQADARSLLRTGAAGGQIGSGELRTSLGNLANTEANELTNAGQQYMQNAELGSIQDMYNNIGIAQQQQQFQAGQQENAFNQAVAQQQLQDALTNSAFGRGLESEEAGYANNPASTDLLLSQLTGQQAGQAGQAASQAFANAGASSVPNLTAQALQQIFGGGSPGGATAGLDPQTQAYLNAANAAGLFGSNATAPTYPIDPLTQAQLAGSLPPAYTIPSGG